MGASDFSVPVTRATLPERSKSDCPLRLVVFAIMIVNSIELLDYDKKKKCWYFIIDIFYKTSVVHFYKIAVVQGSCAATTSS